MSEDHDHRPAAALVEVAIMVIGGVVLQLAQRKAAEPDGEREVRMWLAKTGERVCARVAARSWKLAERCRRAYEAQR